MKRLAPILIAAILLVVTVQPVAAVYCDPGGSNGTTFKWSATQSPSGGDYVDQFRAASATMISKFWVEPGTESLAYLELDSTDSKGLARVGILGRSIGGVSKYYRYYYMEGFDGLVDINSSDEQIDAQVKFDGHAVSITTFGSPGGLTYTLDVALDPNPAEHQYGIAEPIAWTGETIKAVFLTHSTGSQFFGSPGESLQFNSIQYSHNQHSGWLAANNLQGGWNQGPGTYTFPHANVPGGTNSARAWDDRC